MTEDKMTPEMRMAIIRSVRSSQALAGLEISLEEAERLFDEAMAMPELVYDGQSLRDS